jgi:hypothetical protein
VLSFLHFYFLLFVGVVVKGGEVVTFWQWWGYRTQGLRDTTTVTLTLRWECAKDLQHGVFIACSLSITVPQYISTLHFFFTAFTTPTTAPSRICLWRSRRSWTRSHVSARSIKALCRGRGWRSKHAYWNGTVRCSGARRTRFAHFRFHSRLALPHSPCLAFS